jgi:hypothetical protein
MLKLILFATGLLALGVAGIAIKIWAKKDGEFAGTCASNSPVLNNDNESSCTVCGARPDERCKN